MKKNRIFSLILALTLVLSMGVGAFAVGGSDPAGNLSGDQTDEDWTSVKFKKSVTTTGTTGAKNPAETFGFTITPVSATNEQEAVIPVGDMPVFNPATFNITVDEESGEAIVDVELPTFSSVGTYVYKVVETASDTAGMVYDTTEYTFTVVVLNDGEKGSVKRLILADGNGKKTDVFDNNYNAGSLNVNKEITGNNANFEETFPVKVTLTAPESEVINSTIAVTGAVDGVTQSATGENQVTIEFEVTNDSNVTIDNIPAGVSYVVKETNSKKYTPTYTNEEGTIVVNETSTTDIVNDLSKEIQTGISFDNLPYILLLAGAAIGLGALVIRKRKNNEY